MLSENEVPRCGDMVKHLPTGQEWTVAWADPDTGRLAWTGWPEGTAYLSDCKIIFRVSDIGFQRAVENWEGVMSDSRPAKVVAMYSPRVQKMREVAQDEIEEALDEEVARAVMEYCGTNWRREQAMQVLADGYTEVSAP